MRILVVDDEPDVLALCRLNLSFDGHEVIEATDGPEGFEAAVIERPDVIVLDVMLPHGDGLSMLGELREIEQTRDIPVILLSAKAWREDQYRGLAAGAASYMTKPFSPHALSETVRRVVEMTPEDRRSLREDAQRQLAMLQHAQ